MSIHESGTNHPMSYVVSHEQFQEIVRRAEDREKARLQASMQPARRSLARRWGVAPGTLENVRRGRLKRLSAVVRDRIAAAVISDLDADIRRLEHEKQLLLQSGSVLGANEILEIETWLSKARSAIDAVKR